MGVQGARDGEIPVRVEKVAGKVNLSKICVWRNMITMMNLLGEIKHLGFAQ